MFRYCVVFREELVLFSSVFLNSMSSDSSSSDSSLHSVNSNYYIEKEDQEEDGTVSQSRLLQCSREAASRGSFDSLKMPYSDEPYDTIWKKNTRR